MEVVLGLILSPWLDMDSLTHTNSKYLSQDQPYQQLVKEGEGLQSPTFDSRANGSQKIQGEDGSLSLTVYSLLNPPGSNRQLQTLEHTDGPG